MDPSKALDLDYMLCDMLNISMDTLDSLPLSFVLKLREIVKPMYEEGLDANSIV